MCKRVLSFLLAALAVFCFICSSLPMAQAIVPLGLVQSALASYVTSAGYKLYNDEGTGQDILGSLGELYDDYVTLNSKTISGNLATLAYLVNTPLIYTDNSGQICINAVAANIMQDFADWIQNEYSVSVGSDTPTQILQGSAGDFVDQNGLTAVLINCNVPTNLSNGASVYVSEQVGSYNGNPMYAASFNPIALYSCGCIYNSRLYVAVLAYSSSQSQYVFWLVAGPNGNLSVVSAGDNFYPTNWLTRELTSSYTLTLPINTVSSLPFDRTTFQQGSSVGGLAVTLAQAVADVVGQAADDDAVVIGVGAGVGATAQDIADAVASGVKAQTLNPSVSVVAEAVIDTPVQPYPDIDGLGLPQLGAALVDRFPFCIPWDFVDTVRLLSADPQPINITVDLIPQRIKTAVGISSDTSFDIDLSGEQYAKIGFFCRWGSLISFCFALFLFTKRLVWTA